VGDVYVGFLYSGCKRFSYLSNNLSKIFRDDHSLVARNDYDGLIKYPTALRKESLSVTLELFHHAK
jgi:hypothetical protein